jgi:hypothetical protein
MQEPQKRKPTYAQSLALQKAQRAARAAARARRRQRDVQTAPEPAPEASAPPRCPECEGTRRHDEFCSQPVQLEGS